ncbi:uncharacterized protein LOC108156063 [Drosophila miranda]|uniref:uncharacterized protein LOC108156063 n=1 Tax=Drosophila miranda TaxID=7229 RepID=UPI00143F5A69|nr:uncharacterized protein LOC108156063 [Drosophila miranda]
MIIKFDLLTLLSISNMIWNAICGEIWDWCCFWNAEIGCQQLRGRFYHQNSSWNEDETCDLCLQSCDCHSKDHVSRNRLSRVLVLCLTIIRIY